MSDYSTMTDAELIGAYEQVNSDVSVYDATQNALKRALNSCYGAMANQHFRYFNPRIAEGITLSGQMTIKYIANSANKFLNDKLKTSDVDYVIASDTDSIYLKLETLVDSVCKPEMDIQAKINFVDKFVNKFVEPFIENEFNILQDYLNCSTNLMIMKREAIADVGIWRAKKNYILQVWDNENVRYTEPDLKMMGIETARSSTPKIVRVALEKSLDLMLNSDNETLIKFVADFKNTYMSAPLDAIAVPRGINDLKKWIDGDTWITGAPIHVKAAIVYNRLLKQHKMKLSAIQAGNKIKFIYLKPQNPTHNNAIAFVTDIPKEFGLDSYIDKDLQFDKSFVSPLISFTDIVGWTTEKVASLDDLFSADSSDAPRIVNRPKVQLPNPVTRTTKETPKADKPKKPKKQTNSLFD